MKNIANVLKTKEAKIEYIKKKLVNLGIYNILSSWPTFRLFPKTGLIVTLYRPLFFENARSHLLEAKKNLKSPILDAGCGTGWLSLNLYKFGFNVVALDVSEKMLLVSKALFEIEDADTPLIRASITHLPFRDNSFNSIICLEVIEICVLIIMNWFF